MLTEQQKKCLLLGRQKGLIRNRPKGLKYIIKKQNPTSFKKGQAPWNKGTKGIMKAWNKGVKGTHFSPSTEYKKGQNTDEKHPGWKGDNVGYHALHRWISRHFIKPKLCEFCKKETKIQWASLNYNYSRKRDDWIPLCSKCHMKYDSINGWGIATKKFPYIKK